MSDERLILFDGVCNLCQKSVQLVIRNDRKGLFRFASLQSQAAAALLRQHDYQQDELSSVLLIEGGRLYQKSRAALRIARRMDGIWPSLYYLFAWIPRIIADPVYDYVGQRRYRWFGIKEHCWVPDESLKSRFIDTDPKPAADAGDSG